MNFHSMSHSTILEQIEQLLPALKKSCKGRYIIGLGGSIAKGSADAHADIDLYIIAEDWGSLNDTAETFKALPEVTACTHWEPENRSEGGVDFTFSETPVECWWRRLESVDTTFSEAYSGTVKIDPVFWTPAGFYNHTLLSDLHYLIPLADPDGILKEWQKKLQQYPQKLKESIIKQNIGIAGFWRDNPHLESALKRDDLIYLSSIQNQGIQCITQALFAINETYFSGDKKLGKKLAKLPKTPENIEVTINTIFSGKPGRASFAQMYELLDQVKDLADGVQL